MERRAEIRSPEAEELRTLALRQEEQEFRDVFLALAEAYELLALKRRPSRRKGRTQTD